MRGRPPITRARVLNYIDRHHPATVMQIARAMQIDRANVYRILRAAYGPNFRDTWRVGAIAAPDGMRIAIAA